MKFISNRGNIEKPSRYFENKIEYVDLALQYGYDCKVDVWLRDGEWWLGHDAPRYKVSDTFLERDGIWCLAKNIDTFIALLKNKHIHSFWLSYWIEQDSLTLTNREIIWTIDNQLIRNTENMVYQTDMFDVQNPIPEIYGICCNNIKAVREIVTKDNLPLFHMTDVRRLRDVLPEYFVNEMKEKNK